jgi:hypothetical protein
LKKNGFRSLFSLAVVGGSLALVATSATLAYPTVQGVVANGLKFGRIKIDVQQAEDKKIYVENLGSEAFVKATITKQWKMQDDEGEWVVDTSLSGENVSLKSGWEEVDGLYYTYLAENETSEPLIKGYELTEELDNRYQNKKMDVVVHAEAIQTSNEAMEAEWQMTYDAATGSFSEGVPTGKTDLITSDMITEIKVDQAGVAFETAKNFVEGGLFDNFEGVMPGDVRTQTVRLSNYADQAATLTLIIQPTTQDELSEDTRQALNDLLFGGLINLKITGANGEPVLYEGVIGGKDGNIKLGTLLAQHSSDLELTVTVAGEEVGNVYQELLAQIDWIVEAQWLTPSTDEDDNVSGGGDGSAGGDGSTDSTPDNTPGGEEPDNAETPDTQNPDQAGTIETDKTMESAEDNEDDENPDENVAKDLEAEDYESANEEDDENSENDETSDTPLPNQKPLAQTGDSFPLIGLIALGLVSLTGIGGVVLSTKKRKMK